MRRHFLGTIPIVALLTLIATLFAPAAHAQYPGPQGPMMFSSNCAGSPQFGYAALCFDTTKFNFWNYSSGFVQTTPSWSFISASAGNANGATDYLQAGGLGSTAAQGTQATAYTIAPVSGTANNLYCRNATAADNGTGVVYTVYDGTNAQSLTCTTSTAAVSTTLCHDTSDSFAVTAGDLLTIKVVNGNSAAANGVTECSFMVR